MIASQLAADASTLRGCPAILTAQRCWTYGELFAVARALRERCAPLAGQIVGLIADDLPSRVGALWALEQAGAIPCCLPRDLSPAALADWQARLPLAEVMEDVAAEKLFARAEHVASRGEAQLNPALAARETLWLFTSGTTGPPQPVEHRWTDLTATVQQGERFRRRRWLLAYDGASFAGMQVWLQALLTGGCVSDVSQASPAVAAERLIAEQVEFASGTPTFWRMLLAALPADLARRAALTQITLGGEPVSQGTLDALRAAFPAARLTHIYATTELGVCFSVSDGLAGFPVEYLTQQPLGCGLRIAEDGELCVRSPRRARSLTNHTDWIATGDLVERRGARIYFVGRKAGAILVGGGKVLPEEVEAVIRAVPGVVEVLVSAQASSVLGALVRAEVQLSPGADENKVRAAILAHCQAQLPRYKVPAMMEFQAALPRTPSGKLARSGKPNASDSPRETP